MALVDARALRLALRPVRTQLALACSLQLVSAVAALVPFVCVAEAARELLAPGGPDRDRIWQIAGVAIGAFVVRFAALTAASAITHAADNELQLLVRRRVVAHLTTLPLGWFGGRSSGEIKKAVQDDVAEMHHLVAHALLDLCAAVATPLVAFAYLAWIDWRLALVLLVPLPVFGVAYLRMMRDYGARSREHAEALGQVNAATVEFVQGIAVVKSFGQAGRAHERFTRAADGFADAYGAWVGPIARAGALAELAVSPPVMLLVALTGGTLFVSQGWMTPVDVVPFALLAVALTAPILSLGYTAAAVRQAAAAANRVAALLETPPLSAPRMDPSPGIDGATVDVQGATFAYDGAHDVVQDVDLTLAPGTVTALVGASGSGKSTLARLVPRFWDVREGAVRIGGADVRDLDADRIFRTLAIVFQDVQLVRASVRDTIRMGRPDATDAEVEAAARAARIHEQVLCLPRGYDSVIGEDALLSGGEAQRLSIARALVADRPVLVLDEATAFADPESEAAVQDALSELAEGRTLLVIAHRLGTVAGADEIVVLDDGRVVERGRHEELLRLDGAYARMWAAERRAVALGLRDDAVPPVTP